MTAHDDDVFVDVDDDDDDALGGKFAMAEATTAKDYLSLNFSVMAKRAGLLLLLLLLVNQSHLTTRQFEITCSSLAIQFVWQLKVAS